MREIRRTAALQAGILFGWVVVAWAVEGVDRWVYAGALEQYGIHPRDVPRLWGILAAPLLHAGWLHLGANTGPFVILGWLVMLRRIADFWIVTALAVLIGGLGVWLLAPANTVHLGASGVIFGYLGYLLARGYFERSVAATGLALTALVLYGGILLGVLPGQPGISWQGHVFGFIGGGVAAWVLVRSHSRRKPRPARV